MSATLYQAQLDVFLDPNDPAVIAEAERQGIPHAWLESAKASPIWKMAMEWKIAFPLHPEYRTLPMVWYVPPLSPITSAASAGKIGLDGGMPDVKSLRIPVKYLANLLTAGDEEPVTLALQRMLAMRAFMRAKTIDGVVDEKIAKRVGLTPGQIEEMYQLMAIANYEDRFVIPTAHRETGADAFEMRGSCGFTFGNGCSGGESRGQPVRFAAQGQDPDGDGVMKTFKVLSALLSYPTRRLIAAAPGFGAVLRDEKILPAGAMPGGRASGGRDRRRRSLRIAGALWPVVRSQQDAGIVVCSSTFTAKAATAVRPWSISRRMYEEAGLVIAANELPDYVPLFLEYLSTQPLAAARELLAQPAHIFAALAERLGRRQSSYKSVFDALVAIAEHAPQREIVEQMLQVPDHDPMDLQALDAAWEEEEVRFGPATQGEGACGHEGLIAKLRHAKRAVDPAPSSLN